MDFSRRDMLGATGALIVGAAGAGQVLGAPQDIEIEVFAGSEYVILHNTGDEDVDLAGYRINFEYGGEYVQDYEFEDGTVVRANGDLVVVTGADPSEGYSSAPAGDVNAGYDDDGQVLNDDDPDGVALLDPAGNVVASREINTPSPTATATRTPTEEPTETATPEPEDTPTPTEEPKETPTATEEPTETSEPTEEPEDTPTSTPDDGEGGTASVTFDDQDSNGSSVVVQRATLSDGGFLVVHDGSGAVLGNSAYLEAGTQSNVEVTLDDPITDTQTLIAMAHTDDGDRSYEFPDADGPYTAGGAPVTDDARITIC